MPGAREPGRARGARPWAEGRPLDGAGRWRRPGRRAPRSARGVRPSGDRTWSASSRWPVALEHRVAGVALEASRGEEGGSGASGEERAAAGHALSLRQSVHSEATRPFEPDLVLRPLERGKQREAVARGAMADPVPLLVARRTCLPDELCTSDEKLLVEIVARGGDDSRPARTPLELALASPVREPVLTLRRARECGGGLGAQRLLPQIVYLDQRPHVAGVPVHGSDPAEARPPEALGPEAIRVAAGGQRVGR